MQHDATEQPTRSRLLTVRQARFELGGIAHTTIYRLFGSGELPSVLIGGRRLVRPEDLERFVAGKVGANPPARRHGRALAEVA